ncbi:MAG: hypothetical protein OEW89_00280 [Gammaproteobacteria bacterium]|nr:hypothetical protein [Gammaproteobacteria bacterium]MDH5593391.1 hypothetical protein [Gammaproteobacteria bacterium]
MKLEVIIEGNRYHLNIPQDMLDEGHSFFDKMDADMDKGWQVGRVFIENPDINVRCRIVADRILTAMENEDKTMALLMSAYIVTRMPEVSALDIDVSGEMDTRIIRQQDDKPELTSLSPKEAMAQTEKDVARVYKVGKVYRFATFNHIKKEWIESPPFETEEEAKDARLQAMNVRYEELTGAQDKPKLH